MKYKVLAGVTSSKDGRKRIIIKWLLYIALLVFFYTLSRSGVFGFWQPVFIIPLCVAVSMREQELPSCFFAFFCGLYIDCAFGFLFGFSAFWLVLAGLGVSLLTRNLVQSNLLNFFWLTSCTVVLEFSMDYLFNVLIWEKSNPHIVLIHSIIPTAAVTLAFSPAVYILIKAIYNKFSISNASERYEPAGEEDDESAQNEQR